MTLLRSDALEMFIIINNLIEASDPIIEERHCNEGELRSTH
jgi:hypothetical protein